MIWSCGMTTRVSMCLVLKWHLFLVPALGIERRYGGDSTSVRDMLDPEGTNQLAWVWIHWWLQGQFTRTKNWPSIWVWILVWPWQSSWWQLDQNPPVVQCKGTGPIVQCVFFLKKLRSGQVSHSNATIYVLRFAYIMRFSRWLYNPPLRESMSCYWISFVCLPRSISIH